MITVEVPTGNIEHTSNLFLLGTKFRSDVCFGEEEQQKTTAKWGVCVAVSSPLSGCPLVRKQAQSHVYAQHWSTEYWYCQFLIWIHTERQRFTRPVFSSIISWSFFSSPFRSFPLTELKPYLYSFGR